MSAEDPINTSIKQEVDEANIAIKKFEFDHEPTFAELWDKCVYSLLYDVEKYKGDIEALLAELGINKNSDIIDVSAGGGFPALELIEDDYNVTCTDGYADQVVLLNQKALNQGLKVRCDQVLWNDLLEKFPAQSFDFMFCRGNSFIYAGGGWNSMIKVDTENALDKYKQTLKTFYDLLKDGGWIYIDKFKDTETTHREKVGEIEVQGEEAEELIFWTERFPAQKIRQASMIRKKGDQEQKVPNITYDLSSSELESILREVGFKNVQKKRIDGETHFDIWIAQK